MHRHPCLSLWLIALLGLSTEAVPAAAQARGKPNILWLVAEDFGPHLGCYGTEQVWTPNLDRLAAEGVRYTRAFTTAPVCSASRSAFMTGMYQTTIGAHNHRSHRDDGYQLPDGVKVITDWLRDAGYFTANVRAAQRLAASRAPARPTGTSPTRASRSTRPTGRTSRRISRSSPRSTSRRRTAPSGTREGRPGQGRHPALLSRPSRHAEDWAAYLDAASELDARSA